MQKRSPPLGFLTNRIGDANRAWLCSMNPFPKFSNKYYFIASSSSAVCLYSGWKPRLWFASS